MSQMELFAEDGISAPEDAFGAAEDLSALFERSVDAYYAVVHARMSCLPIKKEIDRFIEKVSRAGGRAAADKTASDRGDGDVLAVLKAADKVRVEIHRLIGLLRFTADPSGVYVARCAPDYFILPALAEHFTLRFGETPWAIIDEKRKLCLRRGQSSPARLTPSQDAPAPAAGKEAGDSWEELWRLYHRSINNETRNNPRLQRQFMPERYQKYLPEMD